MSKLRDSILAIQDIQYETVYVPHWKETVRVRGMTAAERDAYEAEALSGQADKSGRVKPNLKNSRARMCVRCVVDENGARVFSDADADALGAKSASAVDAVYAVAARLSGFSKQDEDELGKACAGTTSGDSPSGSPPSSE
jgi:hypothetical protein